MLTKINTVARVLSVVSGCTMVASSFVLLWHSDFDKTHKG